MEGRVIVFHGLEQGSDFDRRVQLLADLPHQGFLRVLSRLDLPARELPPVLPITVSPLRRKDAILPPDHGGNHFDVLHTLQN